MGSDLTVLPFCGIKEMRKKGGAMKVGELLPLINDEVRIHITNGSHDVISLYDGKESIDPRYNDYEIAQIFVGMWTIEIQIKED